VADPNKTRQAELRSLQGKIKKPTFRARFGTLTLIYRANPWLFKRSAGLWRGRGRAGEHIFAAHARFRVQHAWGEWRTCTCRAPALQWRIRAAQAAQIGPRTPDGLNKAQHSRQRDKKHADEPQPVAWAGFSLPAAPAPTLTGTPTAFQHRQVERVQQAAPRGSWLSCPPSGRCRPYLERQGAQA